MSESFTEWLCDCYQLGFEAPNPARAAATLERHPEFLAEPAGAWVTGSIIDFDPARVNEPMGPLKMPPLNAVAFSALIRIPHFAEPLRRAAERLLDAGADVNSTWTDPNFPQWPLSALYGAAGLNHDAEMTRLFLGRGANPNDGESLYHSLEVPDLTCTRLLLDAGADPVEGNAVRKVLDSDNLEGLKLVLARGGDPNALDHAIKRRRSPAHFRELLQAGADTAGAYRLAMINGLTDVAALLPQEPLSGTDAFIAACARGDREEAQRLFRPGIFESMDEKQLRILPDLAQEDRNQAVQLMVELGWPIATPGGDWKASALNHAIFRGNVDLARFLLAHGASWTERHGHNDDVRGTLSWTSRNSGMSAERAVECAKVLIEAGMPVPDEEDYPFPPEVEEYFRRAGA